MGDGYKKVTVRSICHTQVNASVGTEIELREDESIVGVDHEGGVMWIYITREVRA